MYTDEPVPAGRRLVGVEAVIDKDLASALLAIDLDADALVIATDVDAVYAAGARRTSDAIRRASPGELAGLEFAEGSMGPKVRAACMFVERTGGTAAIGSISDIAGPAARRGRDDGQLSTRPRPPRGGDDGDGCTSTAAQPDGGQAVVRADGRGRRR